MQVTRGGKFSFHLNGERLSKGLRPSKRMSRNSGFLIQCQGAVGRDKILQILDEYSRLDATVDEGFPFPQLFVFINLIIVCGQTKIYEWVSDALVEKLTVTPGQLWVAVDFYDYVYMSNSKVTVVRSAASKTFSETSDLPTALAMCNFNGQVIIGSPDVSKSCEGTTFGGGAFDITVEQQGVWS